MNFDWTDQQLAFRDRMHSFASDHLTDDVIDRDERSEFAETLWQRAAEFGIQGMFIPTEFGGTASADIQTAMLAMEALGYGCADGGLLLALNAQMWAVQLPILHFGSDFQKQHFLPNLCGGRWKGAHGITEPSTGSDVFNLKTTAEKVDGGYVLNGTKCMVTLAPICDVALVVASTNPAKGKWGVSTFLVESGFAGFSRGENHLKMGLRTVPIGELRLEDCFVPDSHRLGKEGGGFATFNYSLEFERCCILASQVGTMQRQLETCIRYAKERHQFGQPIGKFQSVSNRIADMKVRLETSKLMLYKVAWLKSQGKSAMMDAAILKLYLSECFAQSSEDAVRIHGGRGYLTENGVDRDWRDAIGGVLYAGTSDIQRNIVAGLLGV
ncbi:Acyl-CoA dehydrogenase [Stieleria maiorica]|uniref:Acyl-CoA dehydrogenase n=1 Tax=Stieleria maiorica TaxID=2795974 RepID=A0A5B9MNW5_9BACT|nr:acyl-CoA dehydrogenase family protein [Stieleria maiorica]QEG01375.1 Acyl-CoA dehydrogenase [Stieleria maiorica]